MRPPAPTEVSCKHGQPLHAEDLAPDHACLCCGRPKRDGTAYLERPRLCISCLIAEQH